MLGITNPAEKYFKDGTWGWDGSVWRKLPMVWGYSAHYCEALSGVATGGGNADVVLATVDPGEVWVIESVTMDHDAGAAKHISVHAYNNGCRQVIFDAIAADSGIYYIWNGRVTLPSGGNMFARAYAPGDGKKLNVNVWGYKMKIAE